MQSKLITNRLCFMGYHMDCGPLIPVLHNSTGHLQGLTPQVKVLFTLLDGNFHSWNQGWVSKQKGRNTMIWEKTAVPNLLY